MSSPAFANTFVGNSWFHQLFIGQFLPFLGRFDLSEHLSSVNKTQPTF